MEGQQDTLNFLSWEAVYWKAQENLQKIITPEFAGRLDISVIIDGRPGCDGALERLKRYYENGVERLKTGASSIRSFDGWFFSKCQSAAQDARREFLGLRKTNIQQPIQIPLEVNAGSERKPIWKPT